MYEEEGAAEACVKAVCNELRNLTNRSVLIVVNDGSKDGTQEILQRLTLSEKPLIVVNHLSNRGYGAALRTGLEEAAKNGYDYALFMDSDLTNDPHDIPRFITQMEQGVDVIKATRYSKGGKVSGVPFYRVAISVCGNLLARLLFGLPIHDCTNGFRAGKVGLMMQMNLTENRFPIIMEELYWCRFLAQTYAEVPVTLTNRKPGQRATSFVYKPAVFY